MHTSCQVCPAQHIPRMNVHNMMDEGSGGLGKKKKKEEEEEEKGEWIGPR